MPKAEEIMELARRCEEAKGPDRELDCAIAVALERTNEGGSGFHRTFSDDSVFEQVRALAFTASLDAAMSLVPEGLDWIISSINPDSEETDGRFWALVGHPDETADASGAATPALALTAAALKSIAVKGKGNE